MERLLPNLADLVQRLPGESLARWLAMSCEGCTSVEEVREALCSVVQARVEAERTQITDAEGQMDRD